VLVLPQLCISSQRLPSRWRIRRLLRRGYLVAGGYCSLRSGYLVAGGLCRLLLRSGYLVACGWMLSFLTMDALPPRPQPSSVGDHCADVFLLAGIVSQSVEVEVLSPLVYSCCLFVFFVFVSLGFHR
jgi:hypothetical protein